MRRNWQVHGRNGHWAVDEHRTGESGTRTTAFISNRRQDAATVAAAMNAAYAVGVLDGADAVVAATEEAVSRETEPPYMGSIPS